MTNRRDFLKRAAGSFIACASFPSEALSLSTSGADPEGADFTRWYDVDRSMTNLENGYWNIMARPVMEEYLAKTEYINRRNVTFARGVLPQESLFVELDKVRTAVASLVNVRMDEIAITRCGTEGLQDLIAGYNQLKPGDSIIYSDLDYDSMQDAMQFLKGRRGVDVVTFSMPEPATTANILSAYDDVLKKTPKAKMMLVTHVSHRTGLVNPVKDIIALARRYGVVCILDVAQSVGQMNVDLQDIDADFAGFSLHKWVGAPLGTGAMYIRKSKLNQVDTCLGNSEDSSAEVSSRIYSGTYNFAAMLTIPRAIAFHNQLTVQRKQARLQSLRDYWVSRARGIKGLEILTPDDPARYGATTSFRAQRIQTEEQTKQFQKLLVSKYQILTVARLGIARGPAIRVTPGLYNTTAELDKLNHALEQEFGRTA